MSCHLIRQWTAAGALAALVAFPACGSGDSKTAVGQATRAPAATAASEQAPSAPASLRGSWKRTMTRSDWKSDGFPVGTFRLEIDPTGAMDVYFPNTDTVDFSTGFVANGSRMTIDAVPVCPGVKGRYSWSASRAAMTLTVVSDDDCAPRAALFGGTWRR